MRRTRRRSVRHIDLAHVADGAAVARGDVLATVAGPTRALLTAERTALNLLCRMSGVATHTRALGRRAGRHEGAACSTPARPRPGLRVLEKYAVRAGGGTNKRMGLYDVAMIKDNHKIAAGGLAAAFRRVRAAFPDVPVQVEVTTRGRGGGGGRGRRHVPAAATTWRRTLLREVVAAVGDRAELEATGGLTLDEVARVRRDRRRLPFGRGADPLVADSGHRAGPARRGRLLCCCASTSGTPTRCSPRSRATSWSHSWRIKTDARSTADELGLHAPRAARRRRRGDHRDRGLLDRAGGAALDAHRCWPATTRDVPAVIVEPGVRTGVQLAIDNPKEVGADRVVNTLAAYTLFGGPVDRGRLRHLDQLRRDQSARGEFLGGVLAPGIEISVDALAARAAQLRKVELVKPPRGDRQEHRGVPAVRDGVRLRRPGRRHGARIIAELGAVKAVIATGGLAPVVIDECATVTHHEPCRP